MNQKMKKTRKILLWECLGSVALLLLLALVFETGLVEEGLWVTPDGTPLFMAQSLMTILLFVAVPGALYLFRIRSVRQQLTERREAALLRWGSLRILMVCVPMVIDLLLYYLFGSVVGFFYMAVIHLLTITFVFPTQRRCEHDCLPAQEPVQEEDPTQENRNT